MFVFLREKYMKCSLFLVVAVLFFANKAEAPAPGSAAEARARQERIERENKEQKRQNQANSAKSNR